jgi:hypothetical protein
MPWRRNGLPVPAWSRIVFRASERGLICGMTLAVNLLTQAAVITVRALSAGIPFAPEKDGKGFLSGAGQR